MQGKGEAGRGGGRRRGAGAGRWERRRVGTVSGRREMAPPAAALRGACPSLSSPGKVRANSVLNDRSFLVNSSASLFNGCTPSVESAEALAHAVRRCLCAFVALPPLLPHLVLPDSELPRV